MNYNFSDAEKIYSLLEEKIPFSWSKMNDGEITAIIDINGMSSRGAQQNNKEMAEKLLETLKHRQENYFLGIPCSRCYSAHHNFTQTIVSKEEKHISLANLLINPNTSKTIEVLHKNLPSRKVAMVVSDWARVEQLKKIGIDPYKIWKIPNTNAWQKYDEIKDKYKELEPDTVVLMCCGPMGRVLCYEWFKNRPDLTCIETGSLFDPLTKGYWYLYHSNCVWWCPECNPYYSDKKAFEGIDCGEVYYVEVLQYNTFEGYLQMFNNNKKAVYNQLYNLYTYHKGMLNNDQIKYIENFII